MTFKEFVILKEKNFNNHGGDRSTNRSVITRSKIKSVLPHFGSIRKTKSKFFKF